MSDTILHGVLNMPPDCWDNSEIDRQQRFARYVEASQKIKRQEKLINILSKFWIESLNEEIRPGFTVIDALPVREKELRELSKLISVRVSKNDNSR